MYCYITLCREVVMNNAVRVFHSRISFALAMCTYVYYILRHHMLIRAIGRKQQVLQCSTVNMKFPRLFQKYRNIALLTLSQHVIVDVLNNIINKILFQAKKPWITSSNITDFACVTSMVTMIYV